MPNKQVVIADLAIIQPLQFSISRTIIKTMKIKSSPLPK